MGTTMQQIQELLKHISPSEKAQVRQWVSTGSDEVFPGIEKTPGICGGDARVMQTRLPVWGLVEAKREGSSDAEILRAYPSLQPQDLIHAWAYAAAYPDEIESQIRENAEDSIIDQYVGEDKNAATLHR